MKFIIAAGITTLVLNFIGNLIYLFRDIKFFKNEFKCCENNFEKIKFIAIYIVLLVATTVSGYLISAIADEREA